MKILFNFIIIFFIFQNNAFAYLDPGTGSAIIAAIISSIAISLMYLKHYLRKTFKFFKKFFNKSDQKKKLDKNDNI